MNDSVIANPPAVSIGLPVFNGERYLAEAIDSIRAQVFQDWELIICDNASTDATPDICERYAALDCRIAYHRNATNIGLHPNFRKSLSLARGEYFKWMAYDDLILPRFISQCLEGFAANPLASVVYTSAGAIDELGAELPLFFYAQSPFVGSDATARFKKVIDQFIFDNGRSVQVYLFGLIRYSCLQEINPLRTYYASDLNMVAELAMQGPLVRVNELLVYIRQHPDAHHNSAWYGQTSPLTTEQSVRTRLGLTFSTRRKYWEYCRTAAAADISLLKKLRLVAFCSMVPARRFQSRLGRLLKPAP